MVKTLLHRFGKDTEEVALLAPTAYKDAHLAIQHERHDLLLSIPPHFLKATRRERAANWPPFPYESNAEEPGNWKAPTASQKPHSSTALAVMHRGSEGKYCIQAGDTTSRHRATVIVLMNMVRNRVGHGEVKMVLRDKGAFVYRLLRYINSPANGISYEIRSIDAALETLGHDNLHRWLSLLLFCGERHGRQPTCLHMEKSLRIGRMMELLGQRRLPHAERPLLFVTGVLSQLDRVFQQPLQAVLQYFSLAPQIRLALLDGDGPYAPFLLLAKACEEEDESTAELHARECGVEMGQVEAIMTKATTWAKDISQ